MSNAAISFPMLGSWSICPPNSFVLFGHTFYWYGVIIACGFLLAVSYAYRRCGEFGVRQDDFTDVLLFGVPLGIIGARIYYIVFFGSYNTLGEMVAIWEGGLAIYGGVIAAAITVVVVCRVKKISALAVLDVVAFGLLIGQCVGRWGNFMNREAFGSETDILWRMGLTLGGETIYVHPTFLYESLWNLCGFIGLHVWSKRHTRAFDGQIFLMYVAWYGLGRVWIEGLRTDSLYLPGTAVRVSQLLAGVSCAAAAAIIAFVLKRGKCSPDKLWVNRAGLVSAGTDDTADDTVNAAEAEASPVTENTPDTEASPNADSAADA